MAVYQFGSGTLFGTRTDVSNPTPWRFGVLQDVQIDFQFDIKELFGQSQFPVTVARGKGKVPFKAKMARLQGQMFNDLFFGGTKTTGMVKGVLDELVGGTGVIPSTPFQLTVANGANFKEDMGVIFAATGLPLIRVAAAPATGQYTVNTATGLYTFAAADVTLVVKISYTWTDAANGVTVLVTNQLLGAAPTFACFLTQTFNGKQLNVKLYACVSNKLTLPTKQEDFEVMEFDGMAFADASDNVASIYVAE
jgi:hypothetical protein